MPTPQYNFDNVYEAAFMRPGFINLGYVGEPELWSAIMRALEAGDSRQRQKRLAQIRQHASAALARKLAESACLNERDVLVDVGCGFGLQDQLFAAEFNVKDITAYNIATKQIEMAKRLLEHLPPSIRKAVKFKVGDATRLPQPAQSATKVLSLESAFHYDTRERFFAEAHRILLPGGKLALADYALKKDIEFRPPWWLRMRGDYELVILPANRYDIGEYARKLDAIGFKDIGVEDITDKVLVWPKPNDAARNRVARDAEPILSDWLFAAYELMRYYLVVATR